MLPRSHKDHARKAFEKVAKRTLPATHGQLARAIEREARHHRTRVDELRQHTAAPAGGGEEATGNDVEADVLYADELVEEDPSHWDGAGLA